MPKFALPMALLLASVSIAAPACAADVSASLTILSGGTMSADWYGDGEVILRKQLCVASTTGRYSLDINMPGALFGKSSDKDGIEVRFSDAAGFAQSKTVSGPSQLVFTGTSVSGAAECESGALASFEIHVPATTLMSKPAGNYFDLISLAVHPL
jgi:hypothetical protein